MTAPAISNARPPAPWLLFAGDLLCLALFVVLGLRSHAELAQAGAFQRFLLNAGPLALAWTAAALAFGLFHLAAPVSRRVLLARTLAAWLIAAPMALVLRALLLGSGAIAVPFLLVTLAVGGSLLLAWRATALWLMRRA